MFVRLPDVAAGELAITVDGVPCRVRAGDTVVAALLVAGYEVCRTSALSAAGRGPFCMMGTCFECMVTIDGVAQRQACLVPVAAGMRVQTQRGGEGR